MPRRWTRRGATSPRIALPRRGGARPVGTPARLLVGLGNPGAGAAGNRHNAGFMALDALAARHDFGVFRPRARFQGATAEGRVGGCAVRALKPQTYMNESGRAVGAAMRFYRLAPTAVVVLHDEIDLAAGKVRAKQGGGVAGHNGLRSVRAHVGADFWRVRIGVGHPGDGDRVRAYVLSDFSRADESWLAPTLEAVADAFPRLLAGDAGGFMSRVALLAPPPRPVAGRDDGQDAGTPDGL